MIQLSLRYANSYMRGWIGQSALMILNQKKLKIDKDRNGTKGKKKMEKKEDRKRQRRTKGERRKELSYPALLFSPLYSISLWPFLMMIFHLEYHRSSSSSQLSHWGNNQCRPGLDARQSRDCLENSTSQHGSRAEYCKPHQLP